MKEIERYRDLFINREDAYATRRRDGCYICRKKEVTDQVLVDHLGGRITCGWYCLDKGEQTKWACVDADSEDGLKLLQGVSKRLKGLEIPSYIEESREGRGHLWIFLEPLPNSLLSFVRLIYLIRKYLSSNKSHPCQDWVALLLQDP